MSPLVASNMEDVKPSVALVNNCDEAESLGSSGFASLRDLYYKRGHYILKLKLTLISTHCSVQLLLWSLRVTCYQTHTHVFASEDDTNSKPKGPFGNREAVRKYREKKKAQTAYLEEEVKKLRLVNQQLVRKLQGKALLEAELSRLRNILAHLKGKIDSELDSFPFQKHYISSSIFKEGDTVGLLQCQNNLPCFHPHAGSSSSKVNICAYGKCQPEIVDCQVDANNMISTEGKTRDTVNNNCMSSASQD